MSTIAEALKRAQEERERLRAGVPEREAAVDADRHKPSLASVVLRKATPRESKPETPASPEPPSTPVADAIRQAPEATPPVVRAQQQATEAIVEDYAAKRKLHLPASIVVYHERASAAAEQYRRMRDSLMTANTRRAPEALVFTSSEAGEGKTVTVMNLGLAMAEVRANRVLLVDGHMLATGSCGRRTLTEMLSLQRESGLAEYLAAPADEVRTYLKATPWNNLFIMPAGARTSAQATSQLLASGGWRRFLQQVRGNFDWILIDAPPADATPDAGLMGAAADGMIVAFALHHTAREKLETTVRRLKSMNLPVRSCVVTRT